MVPTREWRELYAALDCSVVAAIHPFYTASFRQFDLAGSKIIGSAPVGHDGTEAWLESIGTACNVDRDKIDAAKNRFLPTIKAALRRPSRSMPASPYPATKVRNSWSHGC